MTILAAATSILLTSPVAAFAQLIAASDGPIVYGHHHLNVTSVEAHKKFWIDTLGGTTAKIGASTVETIKFPNVLIVLTPAAPTGGTKGTTVNHIGFQVPNLRAMVDKVKAAGYPVVTRQELPAQYEVRDDIGVVPDTGGLVAFVMGPDETKVELTENTAMRSAIALHHVHFYAPDVEAMRAWYVKVFGATAGTRGSFQTANLPGVSLTFSPATTPVVGTRGRALDHVGFEVKNLEAFVKGLEAKGVKVDRGYTYAPLYALGVAYLTDPWGTYIELNEGLTQVR
jgi:catechol 2,3-dioxygenase-like lactoylglutathione lyase family enzyme